MSLENGIAHASALTKPPSKDHGLENINKTRVGFFAKGIMGAMNAFDRVKSKMEKKEISPEMQALLKIKEGAIQAKLDTIKEKLYKGLKVSALGTGVVGLGGVAAHLGQSHALSASPEEQLTSAVVALGVLVCTSIGALIYSEETKGSIS